MFFLEKHLKTNTNKQKKQAQVLKSLKPTNQKWIVKYVIAEYQSKEKPKMK